MESVLNQAIQTARLIRFRADVLSIEMALTEDFIDNQTQIATLHARQHQTRARSDRRATAEQKPAQIYDCDQIAAHVGHADQPFTRARHWGAA